MTELARRLEEAVSAIRELTNNLEQGYVRKDVYEDEQRSMARVTSAASVRDDPMSRPVRPDPGASA